MTTLDDFYGDGSADNTPECSYCGGQDGKLVVSISDHYGPTRWHHEECKAQDDARTGMTLKPTWDEAVDEAVENLGNGKVRNADLLCLAAAGYGWIEEDARGPHVFIYAPGGTSIRKPFKFN